MTPARLQLRVEQVERDDHAIEPNTIVVNASTVRRRAQNVQPCCTSITRLMNSTRVLRLAAAPVFLQHRPGCRWAAPAAATRKSGVAARSNRASVVQTSASTNRQKPGPERQQHAAGRPEIVPPHADEDAEADEHEDAAEVGEQARQDADVTSRALKPAGPASAADDLVDRQAVAAR